MPKLIYPSKKKYVKNQSAQQDVHSQKGRGHWTHQENMDYIGFLEFYQNKLQQRECRRLWKVFKAMSSFLKTRSPNQCRSHHQKMLENQGSIENIIKNFKQENQPYLKYYKNIYEALSKIEQMNNISILAEDFIPSQESLRELEQTNTNKSSEIINIIDENSRSPSLELKDQFQEKQFIISKNSSFKELKDETQIEIVKQNYPHINSTFFPVQTPQLEFLHNYSQNLFTTVMWFYEQALLQKNIAILN